jgi:type IV pilus assembly protein PilQ
MEEKKLYNHTVKMNKLSRISQVAYIFLALTILTAGVAFLSSATPAEAAARREIPPGLTMNSHVLPLLAGVQVQQMGGTQLRVRFRGFDIPLPRVASAPGEARIVLQWDGARFPQTADKKDWWSDYGWDAFTIDGTSTNTWWKEYDLPLLTRINAEPVELDSLRLTFITTQPVMVERVEGIAGADELVVILKVYEPDKAPAPAPRPRQYEKGDPLSIKAPVSLQLRDADLKSVFGMLADMQKLNLLLDPSVPSMNVTFSFNGVPYDEAFSYLLRVGGLSYSVRNGMLVVGTEASLGGTLGTEFLRGYNLSYAVNDTGQVNTEIIGNLQNLITLSKTPTIDARNRQIYVTATEEQHREVAAILDRLDHPGRQVMLEARIFEVTDAGTQDLETLMTAVYNHWIASFTGSGINVGYNWTDAGDFDYDDWSLPIGGSLNGSPSLENPPMNGNRLLSVGLNAIERKGNGKNLANPSVITLDGEKAEIDLSQTVSYVSGVDSNGNPSISTISYGPHLSFRPVIGRDGVVTISVVIEAGALVGFRSAGMGAQTPETSNRRVETIVRVRNGEPFVVGGLYQDVRTKERRRLPIIGYIPLLGELFTFRHDEHNKSEVAMIVIPYILDVPNNSIETFDMKKLSNLR